MVKARCSPATFAKVAELEQSNTALAAQYKKQLDCCYDCTSNPTAYVGVWGPDKGALFPFSDDYSDPTTNETGTCYSNLVPIDASTWDSLPMNRGGFQMTKKSFCNLATVGDSPDKQALAKLSKELIDTASVIYTKIQDMELESRKYYQQHNTLNQQLQKKLNSYRILYSTLITGPLAGDPDAAVLLPTGHGGTENTVLAPLESINSQPDITLGGQAEDAQLKATSGYYQYFIWSILAAFTFSYTMFKLRR